MTFTDKYLKERIPAVKTVFKGDDPIEKEMVLEITDYDRGIIEMKAGNAYYRFRHVDLERAVTSIQVRQEVNA
ncbi:hypothetical protein [Sediminispirochaeta smaragdinae]|uniref:Uncharacterized protein n=1 Tax=Sediminispirochaeta smaragdinae (strain DSM 11293 / JCM 15392 / SEBR 4228) TaxID=573413 RepID=E1R1G1_SEDSS|nr:hypothetical protein [Sediminispirochaeta smaragdinae]ADK81102.1 hypothetical protein Spirs_1980 [Sediminispirochaeta smaragdinae DSM 11293]